MKNAWIIRALVIAALAILIGWLAYSTQWVEVEVDDGAHGLAATDEHYSLRQVLQSTGATLELRTALEPLPPAVRDPGLQARVAFGKDVPKARLEQQRGVGGRLVVTGQQMRDGDLRWIPLSFYTPTKRRAASGVSHSGNVAPAPDTAASAVDERDDEDDDIPATRKKPPIADNGKTLALRPAREAVPTWQLTGVRGTLAMRIPLGRGSVTGVSAAPVLDNRGLLQGDNALIAMAILQAAPGRAVWIVEDEAREPLLGWLWHDARAPFLLGLAAIALALWRLMVRFGPREAVPPRARRSMGEQVRGTGQFIAGLAPEALHAATKKAFEDGARKRVEAWSDLTDPERVLALADTLAPHFTLDKAALLSSLNVGGGATQVQILAAIAVLEQARRALLRAPATPVIS
jgi:hypothetical protein